MRKNITFFVVFILLLSCSSIERSKYELENKLQVYSKDAFKILTTAKDLTPRNSEVHERSLAQAVFPKVVKGGFIIGGNYAEGFLIENEKTISQIKMIGGNFGPNVGGQTYSQITYIMDRSTLNSIKNGQSFSLQGTANYAKSGESVTDIFGQLSDGRNLITVIFNQSGYLAGISFEGTYISKKK